MKARSALWVPARGWASRKCCVLMAIIMSSRPKPFAGNAPTAGGASTPPAGATAAATTPGSPGAGSPVASITFAGAGLEHVDVGGFLRALARGPKKGGQQVYLNPYFSTSQKADEGGQDTVTFSATVDLSSAAYSRRFQPEGTVTP